MFSIFSLLFAGTISSAIAAPAPTPQQGGPELTTTDTRQSLRGFEGCSNKDSEAIIDAFDEAQKILSTISISKLNFTSAAALDYFWPSALKKASEVEGNWKGDAAATVYCRTNPKSATDCTGETHAAVAVSNIAAFRGQNSKPYLTFCHQFFDYSRLGDAIKEGQRKEREDVRAYDNRARHWIQALMLIDDVGGPMIAKEAAITDVKMVFPDAPGREFRYVMTPFTAKLLARFEQGQGTVPLAIRNAHNIAWFATAAYAASKVKNNNGILAPALDVEVGKAVAQSAIDRSGTSNSANLASLETLVIKKAKYVTEADYPSEYWKRVKEQSAK